MLNAVAEAADVANALAKVYLLAEVAHAFGGHDCSCERCAQICGGQRGGAAANAVARDPTPGCSAASARAASGVGVRLTLLY